MSKDKEKEKSGFIKKQEEARQTELGMLDQWGAITARWAAKKEGMSALQILEQEQRSQEEVARIMAEERLLEEKEKSARRKKEQEAEEAFKKFMEQEEAEARKQKELRDKREFEEAEKLAKALEAQEKASIQKQEEEAFKKFMLAEKSKKIQEKSKIELEEIALRLDLEQEEAEARKQKELRDKREFEEAEKLARALEAQEESIRYDELIKKEIEGRKIAELMLAKEYSDEFIRREMRVLEELRTEKALKWEAILSKKTTAPAPVLPQSVATVVAQEVSKENIQSIKELVLGSGGAIEKADLLGMGFGENEVSAAFEEIWH